MHITLRNVRATVDSASVEEEAWLREFLTFSVGGFQTSGELTMYRDVGSRASFPSGLLPWVRAKGEARGFMVSVSDGRTVPCSPDPDADVSWLARHQREALASMFKHTRGIVAIATAGGKGDIVVAVGKSLPCNHLVCCDSFALIDDIANRWETHNPGATAGRIGNGRWSLGDGNFVCATWQTLATRLKKGDPATITLIEGADALHADEGHTTPSEQASAVLTRAKNAYYRWAYSGTPLERGDRKSILAVGHFAPVIARVSARELADVGFASRCTVRMLRCAQPWMSWGERPAAAYKEQVVRSVARNAVVMEVLQLAERPLLCFFKEIAHGQRLKKLAERAGIRCDISFGEDPVAVRRTKLRWLVREGNAVLFVNKTFQKGEVDPCIAQVRDVANVAAGRSTIAALQQLGRGMRIERNERGEVIKDSFTLWDIWDVCEGEDGEESDFALARQARERRKAYQRAGHTVIVDE